MQVFLLFKSNMWISFVILLTAHGVLSLSEDLAIESSSVAAITTSTEPQVLVTKSTDVVQHQCFSQPPEACPNETDRCRCKQLPENASQVVCCNIESNFFLQEGLTCAKVGATDEVTSLHIRNATLEQLNVSASSYRRLRSMSVTDGRIKRIIGEFGRHASVECLNMSANAIDEIEPRAFVNLVRLELVDLSENNLTEIPNFRRRADGGARIFATTADETKAVKLIVTGNKQLECKGLQEALTKSDITFLKSNETFCVRSFGYTWFESNEFISLVQVLIQSKMQENCPPPCSCDFDKIAWKTQKSSQPFVKVDCSNRNLTDLPTFLPPKTIQLNVSNNKIESLALLSEPIYDTLQELIADSNRIESLLPLEGTKFLQNFNQLSLRDNFIRSIPLYMFSNTFQQTIINKHVYLKGNPFDCDCNTAKELKNFRYKTFIYRDILYCDNSSQSLNELNPHALCQSTNHNWSDYIYYVIALEIFLLVSLIVKVTYDYCVFKTSGYLPWPASRMPKLPCDWLCEA